MAMTRTAAQSLYEFCRLHGLPSPAAEYAFAGDLRKWRFDFAWPILLIAIEVDGGSFIGGRHTRGAGFKEDCHKLNEAIVRGWRVFRATPQMVTDRNGVFLHLVSRLINQGV